MKSFIKMQPILLTLLVACGSAPPSEQAKQQAPQRARILQFYGANTQVVKGQPLTLCYGVEDAQSVRMEPPEVELGLSRNRCIAVSPKQNTTYILIAKGTDGQEVRQPFPVRLVAASQPVQLIRSFDVMPAKAGQLVNLCYQTKGAASVTLSPALTPVEPAEHPRCVPVAITQQTTFLLTATDAAGNVDRMQVTAKPN